MVFHKRIRQKIFLIDLCAWKYVISVFRSGYSTFRFPSYEIDSSYMYLNDEI